MQNVADIPVLSVSGKCIPEVWESSLIKLYTEGLEIKTEYDKPDDPPSKDATMLLTVSEPLSEPMIHRDIPGGLESLQEYIMEVTDGIKNHWVRDVNDPDDHRWEYTYNERLTAYDCGSVPIDQIEIMCQKLAAFPYTRRAQAVTWNVNEDNDCYDPPCLQSVWGRIVETASGKWRLNMNIRIRSNDAYEAAMMNIFAFVMLQKKIADRVAEIAKREVEVGRYCHLADSYHIYGSVMKKFEERFLGQLRRPFGARTFRYDDVKPIMDEAIPGILERAKKYQTG